MIVILSAERALALTAFKKTLSVQEISADNGSFLLLSACFFFGWFFPYFKLLFLEFSALSVQKPVNGAVHAALH